MRSQSRVAWQRYKLGRCLVLVCYCSLVIQLLQAWARGSSCRPMQVYALKKWRPVSTALQSSDSGSAVAERACTSGGGRGLTAGSLDLHATILSFVDMRPKIAPPWSAARGRGCRVGSASYQEFVRAVLV